MRERDTNLEVYRVAEGLSKTFINRWNLYSKQTENGRYVCIHKNLTIDHVANHLRGKITLGTYLLDEENNARFLVLDADDDDSFARVKVISDEIPSYLESSRRGGHLWVFFEDRISGEKARNFGLVILKEFGVEVEVYPKQSRSDGPGSLVRLPFGIHRKSGERYGFIKPDGSRLGTWQEQFQALITPQTVPNEFVDVFIEKSQPEKNVLAPDRVDDYRVIPVLDFVSQYVDLRKTSAGAVGLCPFHDDHHPSFSVNAAENYWHCFAGCGGGSAVDFWMKWNNCDFRTAVTELEGVIGKNLSERKEEP